MNMHVVRKLRTDHKLKIWNQMIKLKMKSLDKQTIKIKLFKKICTTFKPFFEKW